MSCKPYSNDDQSEVPTEVSAQIRGWETEFLAGSEAAGPRVAWMPQR
jgi:hypothetical protein